ncbi:MAG: creatininase family protein [Spirochaetales bacterium]
MYLASLSWKKAEKAITADRPVIVPLGSVENHGTQLPLGTDFMVPEALARMIEEPTDVLVLPVMPYGVCSHHMDFPGTLNIGHEAFLAVMRNLVGSLSCLSGELSKFG